ncbi:MAG TPA: tetratricopeptide repeat protein [Candidatus Deferrimicrobiaceae bacterium]|nr:tetratricopeptide repeat protein [Candidatus Deferrimicrobiaceae bacterium]
MRAAAVIVLLLGTAGVAGAQSPLAVEVRVLAGRDHETPARIDTLRPAMAQAAQADPHVDNLLALAQIASLALDPRFPPAYALAGTVYYEVPGLFGGDLEKSERLFRKGLEADARFTALRVGAARTLIKGGRIPEARRELRAVLDEKAPSNVADWTLKDSRAARQLLDSLPGSS